jgi:hypothetical protein
MYKVVLLNHFFSYLKKIEIKILNKIDPNKEINKKQKSLI